jgi:glucan phosphoethanolaminetransferase (alkaline phosphatase superfamily)
LDSKRYRITLVGIIVLVIITSLIAIYYYSNKNNTEQARTNSVEYKYYLKEYNNQIGVYKTNEDKPFRTIDVFVFTLPSVDQQELKTGILVQDDDKLRMIIEDYES